MKKETCLLATVVALSFAGVSQAANLLLVPGFEAPDTSAADFEVNATAAAATATNPWYDLINYSAAGLSGDGAYISSDVPAFSGAAPQTDRINGGTAPPPTSKNFANPGGHQYGYAYTSGRPAGTVGGLAQVVTGITAGDSYVGSAYFFDKNNGGGTADGDRLQSGGGSTDSVVLIFQDSTGTQVGTATSSAVFTGAPYNSWQQFSTAAVVAPAGATQVLFELALTRGSSGGLLFADDASLVDTSTTSPEPASLGLLLGGGLLIARRRR